jgi:putative membrane protein insertion efficiency factor
MMTFPILHLHDCKRLRSARLLIMVCFAAAFVGSGETQDTRFDSLCDLLLSRACDISEPARLPVIPQNEPSEIRMVSQVMIRVYQEFISSQQHNVCVFQPSCSHFGQEALKHFGLAKGMLLIADRLQRCNNFASQYGYGYDQATGRLLDPVLNYQFRDIPCDSLPRSKASVAP